MIGLSRVVPQREDIKRSGPALKAVRAQRRALRRTTVALSVLALFLLFGLVGFQAMIVRNQSALDRLDNEIADAQKVNQVLRLDVAELQSPERIRTAALIVLGMVEPSTVTYLEPISAVDLAPSDGSDGLAGSDVADGDTP